MSRKKIKQFESSYKLLDGQEPELLFITRRDDTVCLCAELGYDKLVARHPKCKDLEEKHQALKPLFDQYIADARRALTASR